jgi:hypothetical protein
MANPHTPLFVAGDEPKRPCRLGQPLGTTWKMETSRLEVELEQWHGGSWEGWMGKGTGMGRHGSRLLQAAR